MKHGSSNGGGGAGLGTSSTNTTIPTLPSTYSVHDFHSYGFHGTGVIPGLHFHLAASINAETGKKYTEFSVSQYIYFIVV